jgi:hypothetical protein
LPLRAVEFPIARDGSILPYKYESVHPCTLSVHAGGPFYKMDSLYESSKSLYPMDTTIVEATEEVWKEYQEKELKRAYETMIDIIDQFESKGRTFDAFREIWYSQHCDKKGKKHIYNLAMSCAQTRKAFTGNSFEKAIEKIHKDHAIEFKSQVWGDKEGNLFEKKPKQSVHKHDLIIQSKAENTLNNSYVVSIKTTLRERYRQDLDSIGKCKKLILMTRETPTKQQIESVTGYNCVLVYPRAMITDHTWTYDHYLSHMKNFQKTSRDTTSE